MANKQNKDVDFVDLIFSTFKLLGDSWRALMLNFWTLVMVGVIPALIAIVAAISIVIPFLTNGDSRIISIAFTAILAVLAIVFVVMFLPAVTIIQLASVRGQKVEFKEVFEKSRSLALPYLGLIILVGLTVLLGFILLIIPGIIAAFFLGMTTYIFVDKKCGVIEAYKQSIKLVKENILVVLALFIVNMGVSAVSYVPYIGWIFSLALTIGYFCLPAIIYVKISKK
jgi:hypothetical protein